MGHMAKIFKNGNSQAVRLPKEFRFKGPEVMIHRDPVTGNVVLSERSSERKKWEAFFKRMDARNACDPDFVLPRDSSPPTRRAWMHDGAWEGKKSKK